MSIKCIVTKWLIIIVCTVRAGGLDTVVEISDDEDDAIVVRDDPAPSDDVIVVNEDPAAGM